VFIPDDRKSIPTYAADLAKVILQLRDVSGIVHVCNGETPVSLLEIAYVLKELIPSLRATVIHRSHEPPDPSLAPRPPCAGLATARFTQLTGQRCRPWQEGVRALWEATG